mmetsp:Transcript_41719/g.116291  ORF Transcript_41719/g.116291 Transcript_41719/m.116291 type:complete len:605 (-) Transcript_41719:187-2001(-)
MDRPVGSRRWRPANWLIVLAAAVSLQVGRERLLDGGLLLEELRAIPDPAFQLLEKLNWTTHLEVVKQALAERRDLALPPGRALKDTLTAKHPAILIPGVISCGLEVWQPDECLGDNFFRERIWGGVTMARALVGNITCWLEHMALDPMTGLDPPSKKVRAVEGFSGADYFMPGYWLWGKLLESAAAIGYNPSNIQMMCYDWRLPYSALERRDRYFTRLRAAIEMLVVGTGHKAVVIAHSMGASVFIYFMQWVSRVAGPGWVAAHMHAFIPLAGALLGAVGPLGALLSGEMQSTAILGPVNRLIDSQMSILRYDQIRDFLRTWGSLGSLLPLGGEAVWGSAAAPTDVALDLVVRDGAAHGVEALLAYLREEIGNYTALSDNFHGTRIPPAWESSGADSIVGTEAALKEASSNPLASALPPAPEMRIHCFYGVGIQTERAYQYTLAEAAEEPPKKGRFGSIDYRYFHDANSPSSNGLELPVPSYSSGVASSDGDGTVPLLSLAYMCAGAWREEGLRAFNPSRVPVHIREYPDNSSPLWDDPRGGPATAKHVEILGNREAIHDILNILAGEDKLLQEDRIHSEIPAIAARVSRNLREKLGAAAASGR